ncbi:MAG: hypothetical protein JEZ07_16375 [Phycisphaerae bacterium]|nr:hypothetical protein [Phycisphaerae bacterium]
MIFSVMLTIYLPLAIYILVDDYQVQLNARAHSTPLVIGPRGNRFDLVFHALYFRAEALAGLTMNEMQTVNSSRLAKAIPLHCMFTARDFPIVGTTIEFFEFRDLNIADGHCFSMLGDCVLGADAAGELGLHPGDTLMSDPVNPFDLAGEYPLNMHVCGILEESGTVDDQAIFVDVKTSWVIQGLGHGHDDVTQLKDKSVILSQDAGNVVASSGLKHYMQITADNIDNFHFHGEPGNFPLTAIICLPVNDKSAALLAGRYQDVSLGLQLLKPEMVVSELFAMILKIKRFFDANVLMVSFSTGMLLSLVVLLSIRLRQSEMKTMFYIGCSRGTIFWLETIEMIIVFTLALLLALLLSYITSIYLPGWLNIIFGVI